MNVNRIIFFITIFLFAIFFLPSCSGTSVIVNVFGVSIPEGNVTIEQGQTEQLSASIVPADATNKAVIWESDFTDVAKVDQNGLVTTIVVGQANIIVTTEDGGLSDTVKITVVEATII